MYIYILFQLVLHDAETIQNRLMVAVSVTVVAFAVYQHLLPPELFRF